MSLRDCASRLLSSLADAVLAVGLTLFICGPSWAAGLTVPEGSRFVVPTGELRMDLDGNSGSVNNAGIITTGTGRIRLNGSWITSGNGYYLSSAGTVEFSAPPGTTQLLLPSALSTESFFDLIHSGTGTMKLMEYPVNIDGSFSNLAGVFDPSSIRMNVAGNWNNTGLISPATTVVLDGGDQTITGGTTFFNLTKTLDVAGSHTLTFGAGSEQVVLNSLTFMGYQESDPLFLRSTADGFQAFLTLDPSGIQNIMTVDVKDSNASHGLELVGRGNASHDSLNNVHWLFGGVGVTWVGAVSDNWNEARNWDRRLVPGVGDMAIVPAGTLHQPRLTTNAHVTDLVLRNGSALTLDQSNMTVDNGFTLDGNIILDGMESVQTGLLFNSGTVTYIGRQDGLVNPAINENFRSPVSGAYVTTFYNLVIDDTLASMHGVFSMTSSMTIAHDFSVVTGAFTTSVGTSLEVGRNMTAAAGNMSIGGPLSIGNTLMASGANMDLSTNSVTLTVGQDLTVAGGLINALNAVIDTKNVSITGGTFSAPGAGHAFTVSGNWVHPGGNFTANTGTVTLDGTSAVAPSDQRLSGNTLFYGLRKDVPAGATQPHSLTLTASQIQTVSHYLTLNGLDGTHLLRVLSTSGTQAGLRLLTGGGQTIQYVDVSNNNAFPGVTLVARMSPNNAALNNTNWVFNTAVIKWDGSDSTAWQDQFNWDLGVVPQPEDTVHIRTLDEDHGNAVITRQPILSQAVSVGNLFLDQTNTTLTLNAFGLSVESTLAPPGTLSNNGTVYLQGTEAVSIQAPDPDSGTFVYQGNNSGAVIPFTTSGRPGLFYNLVVRDINATPSTFAIDRDVSVNGMLTVDGGTLNASANALDIAGSFYLKSGAFTAPAAGKIFTIAGDFTHQSGVFTANGGLLTFDGTIQSVTGTTTFASFDKTMLPASLVTNQLIFDHAGTQTITDNFTLEGTPGNHLQIVSNSSDLSAATRLARIGLQAGGTQFLRYLDVKDSDARSGLELVARSSVDNTNNFNWNFGTPTVRWDGSASRDWSERLNWDLGFVPLPGDRVVIRATDPLNGNQAIVNQPLLTMISGAVTLETLTLAQGTSLELNGFGLSVSDSLSNDGNIIARGNEPMTITTTDTNSGTFTFTGAAGGTIPLPKFNPADAGVLFYNLVLENGAGTALYRTLADAHVFGTLQLVGGTLDVSSGSDSLAVDGNTTIDAGTAVLAGDGSLDLGGSLFLNGALTAPKSGHAFTLAGDWSLGAGGVFTNNGGRVTLDTNTPVTITGNMTFYDLNVNEPNGKAITFQAGSTQIIQDNLSMAGGEAGKIILRSTQTGVTWALSFVTTPEQVVTSVDVRDSVATGAAAGPYYILGINSIDQKVSGVSTNTGWHFATLELLAPVDNRIVGQRPLVIGTAVPNHQVLIFNKDNTTVAKADADANGNFMTELDAAVFLTLGANSLTPVYYDGTTDIIGTRSDLTVKSSTTIDEVPVIDLPHEGDNLNGTRPVIVGRGLGGNEVRVIAHSVDNSALRLTLPPDAYAAVTTTSAGGDFSTPLALDLPRGKNNVAVIVNGVASDLKHYVLNDIYGVVFDSTSNTPVKSATITLYQGDGVTKIADSPLTKADGVYEFHISGDATFIAGGFVLRVDAYGYNYPTALADAALPAGRSITPGSRAEKISLLNDVLQVDLPVDANPNVFRVTKEANKAEARIGEVVTYTVTIENMLDQNSIIGSLLNDLIPPGFKFMPGRAQLDTVPLVDPTGNRPLLFNVGTFTPHQKKTLRYQLVIGSGVAPGDYENTAFMRYGNGNLLSNRATALVKVIMDPLFDAGTVFGKVFYDWNENGRQDDPDYVHEDRQEVVEGPVPDVRIVMEDGTVVTADKSGQFHVPGLIPGRHLLRVDEQTLPAGAYLTTDKVVVIDVTPGSLTKVNFGVNIDNAQIVGEDVRFFEKNIKVTQDANQPKPRLTVDMFQSAIELYNDAVMAPVELRIFMNYPPFVKSWKMDVVDKDTKHVVKTFAGTQFNILDPLIWDGRDSTGRYVRADRHYAAVVKVEDDKGGWDETKERDIVLKVLTEAEKKALEIKTDDDRKKESVEREKSYRAWLAAGAKADTTASRSIFVRGETLTVDPMETDVRQVRVLKDGRLYAEVPVLARTAQTARGLLEGGSTSSALADVILPDGDYELEIVTSDGRTLGMSAAASAATATTAPVATASSAPVPGTPGAAVAPAEIVKVANYKKPLKIGEDRLMFLAMGDGKVGYNVNRGNIEPVAGVEQYQPGFYKEGKMAYYLKGKIKGKYLVTSSFDTERQQKAMFRSIKDEEYYPVYGDASSINYDATNTQGPLYLLVEWDKSQAIWGNYAVDFKDTAFAQYSRTLYGGKIDYTSVASNPYGDPKTHVAVFHAEVRQRAARNEFVGTGGSLYYLKHQDIVPGTLKVQLQVRDAITGQVVSTTDMKSNVDYDMDNSAGRILFWRPVAMSADSNRLVSNTLLQGNPVYMVADYEYLVKDVISEGTEGTRVAQAVGKNVVVGGTYVKETQAGGQYELKGQDVTVHVDKDTTVKAEYAETTSQDSASFVSMDGGITFAAVNAGNGGRGRAYGLTQDSRLFDRLGVRSYYKWADNGFATAASTSQGGKESRGLTMTFDLTPVTRLTASQDVQRLIQGGNLQTNMQVGAGETSTTIVSVVHEARRLRLSGALQHQVVSNKSDVYASAVNTATDTVALQAEYDINEKTKAKVNYQVDPTGKSSNTGQITTGLTRQLTDKIAASIEESLGSQGIATKVGAVANITPKLSVGTDYTLAKAQGTQLTQSQTTSVTAKGEVAPHTTVQTTYSVTQGTNAATATSSTTSVSAATQAKIDDATITAGAKASLNGQAVLGQGVDLGASKTTADGRTTTSKVTVDETPTAGKTTSITLGQQGALTSGQNIVAERTITLGQAGDDHADTYKVVGDKDGRKVETAYTHKLSDTQAQHSDSNIFGLTGDVNDRVAANASLEQGKVVNVDGSIYDRTAVALGLGYLEKDENGKEKFKSSTKVEGRIDRGVGGTQQVLLYHAMDGKMSDELSLSGKFQFSRTWDKTTGATAAQYKEIMLGTAYRPIVSDKLSLFAKYTYKENQAPAGQSNTSGVEQSAMQVLSAEGAYDLTDDWQIVEKLAYRIMEEKVAGFDFTKTHTWLLVNRANYRIDQDWKVGVEHRTLVQQEAHDRKNGMLVEAVRSVNDNVELGIGYNFTDFTDDLTSLSYTVQGPFIRMTGKLYDRTPEEKARARQKWIDHRVEKYAWKMVNREFTRKDSPVVQELNQMYHMASVADSLGRYEESRQIYRDVILATQMMFEEAAAFVRNHISFEEKLFNAYQRAREYYDKGDLWQARKLWEKIVEEAEKAVLQ